MRPAGMSSDEDDFDEDYYSETLTKNLFEDKTYLRELTNEADNEMKNFLDASGKVHLFHKAVIESDFQLMDELVQEGISVDEAKSNDWTPLLKACSHGNYEVVRYLLGHGANPNLHKELFTPLMACCIHSNKSEMDKVFCLRLLIQYGAHVNAKDRHRSTALISAVCSGMKEIVNELLSVPDLEINAQDKDGWTALLYAIKLNHKSIVTMLVNSGADLNITTYNDNLTPYELAELKGYTHFFSILRAQGSESETLEISKIPGYEDALQQFFDELPDEEGRGGFPNEVRNIFMGLGYEKMYDRLKINVSFPDFLVMGDNLEKLGVRTSYQRFKLAWNGIHRFHLCPWRRESLHEIKNNSDFNLHKIISSISNIVKHLSILYATLDYIKLRTIKRSKCKIIINQELINVLIGSYLEIQKTNRILEKIIKNVQKIKSAGDTEADYVDRKNWEDPKSKLTCYLWFAICTVAVGGAGYYYSFSIRKKFMSQPSNSECMQKFLLASSAFDRDTGKNVDFPNSNLLPVIEG